MSSELSSGDDCAEDAACDHYSFWVLSTVPDVSPVQVTDFPLGAGGQVRTRPEPSLLLSLTC